jgi:uncharacterized protein (DUF2147 family)
VAGHTASNEDLTGLWRTIDDRTGFSKALVRIEKAKDGSYSGTIVKILPRPDYIPQELCQHCPAPYTNKPILGLTVLMGLKADERDRRYEGGKVLDPLSGRIYSGKARLSSDGRRLSMRGYVGVSMLGRSQSWVRESEDTPRIN